MCYSGFAERITVRYGIVVVNWPLAKFVNPSSVSTKTEAEILWNAWETDTARFYRMTGEEYKTWYAEYQSSVVSSGPQSDGAANQLEGDASRQEEGGRAEAGEASGRSQEAGIGSTSLPGANSSTPPGPLNVVLRMNVVTGGDGRAMVVEKRPLISHDPRRAPYWPKVMG